jgi:hypothetical protein
MVVPKTIEPLATFWNGYVGIPKSCVGYEQEYDSDCFDSIDIHGGLTFSRGNMKAFPSEYVPDDADDYWWVGFDTAHLGDDEIGDLEGYARAETERLRVQIENLNTQKKGE